MCLDWRAMACWLDHTLAFCSRDHSSLQLTVLEKIHFLYTCTHAKISSTISLLRTYLFKDNFFFSLLFKVMQHLGNQIQ